MKSFLKAPLTLSCLFFIVSCEKENQQAVLSVGVNSAVSSTSPERGSQTQPDSHRAQLTSKEGAKANPWLGKVLTNKDKALFEKWTQDLSHNAIERRNRAIQLAHFRRAELLPWTISYQELAAMDAGQKPRVLELPFFGNETLTVTVEQMRPFGEQSMYLQGHLKEDPASKVLFKISNQGPSGNIQGPDSLYYYDAFEGLAILREDEPGSQHTHDHANCPTCEAAEAAQGK